MNDAIFFFIKNSFVFMEKVFEKKKYFCQFVGQHTSAQPSRNKKKKQWIFVNLKKSNIKETSIQMSNDCLVLVHFIAHFVFCFTYFKEFFFLNLSPTIASDLNRIFSNILILFHAVKFLIGERPCSNIFAKVWLYLWFVYNRFQCALLHKTTLLWMYRDLFKVSKSVCVWMCSFFFSWPQISIEYCTLCFVYFCA